MLQPEKLSSLHDSTLERLVVNWESGGGFLQLRSWEGGPILERLEFNGLRELSLPRRFPWGLSVSLNQCRIGTADESGISRLEVELQSGDLLRIEASEFELVRGGTETPAE